MGWITDPVPDTDDDAGEPTDDLGFVEDQLSPSYFVHGAVTGVLIPILWMVAFFAMFGFQFGAYLTAGIVMATIAAPIVVLGLHRRGNRPKLMQGFVIGFAAGCGLLLLAQMSLNLRRC